MEKSIGNKGSGKNLGINFNKPLYLIWVMMCLVLFIIFSAAGTFAVEKKRQTIRSVIVRASLDLKTLRNDTTSVELLKKYKDIGINYVTVYGAGFWSTIEKKPGEYDFTLLGLTLDNVRKAGLKAIVRLGAEFAPEWVWTYGKKEPAPFHDVIGSDKKVDISKTSVYPLMDQNGKAIYTHSIVDIWDATGSFLKLRYMAKACHYLNENYSDVVNYVDAGNLTEGIWRSGIEMTTPTWAPTALDAYRRYLQEIYMDVAEVNKIYNTNWKSLWEAVPPKTYEDSRYFMDWYKWYERGMVAVFMREAAVIRRAGFKVSVLAHMAGTDSSTTPPIPNKAYSYCTFSSPSRIELIDADLYILGGGFNNITWHDEIPYDPYGKNPLVLIPYDGVNSMKKIRDKNSDALFIIEDWEPNPTLAEYIGLSASMIDGFQIMQGSFSDVPWYRSPDAKTPEEMFNKLKDVVKTFFIWKEDRK